MAAVEQPDDRRQREKSWRSSAFEASGLPKLDLKSVKISPAAGYR